MERSQGQRAKIRFQEVFGPLFGISRMAMLLWR